MSSNSIIKFFESISSIISILYVLFNNPKAGVNHPNSHINKSTGNPKIPYSRTTANNEAIDRTLQSGEVYTPYKCPKCSNYHIGHGNNKVFSIINIFVSLVNIISSIIKLFKPIK